MSYHSNTKSLIRTFTWVSDEHGLRQRIQYLQNKKDGQRIFANQINNMQRKITPDDNTKEQEILEKKYDAFTERWLEY